MPLMRCKHCRYRLDGLADNRCPECGEAFDPDDPTTFDAGSRSAFWSWVIIPLIVVLCYLMPFLIFFDTMGPMRLPQGGTRQMSTPSTIFFGAVIPAMFAWPLCLAIAWLVWTVAVRVRDRNR